MRRTEYGMKVFIKRAVERKRKYWREFAQNLSIENCKIEENEKDKKQTKVKQVCQKEK